MTTACDDVGRSVCGRGGDAHPKSLPLLPGRSSFPAKVCLSQEQGGPTANSDTRGPQPRGQVRHVPRPAPLPDRSHSADDRSPRCPAPLGRGAHVTLHGEHVSRGDGPSSRSRCQHTTASTPPRPGRGWLGTSPPLPVPAAPTEAPPCARTRVPKDRSVPSAGS